jgi:glycosyltransferase involved in cell wall biosynthesis
MDAVAELVTAPLMPWDALICTSSAVAATVGVLLEAQGDYLKWRLGSATLPRLPCLPVIPLGVHCDDFAPAPQARQLARQALGIGEDEIVALFVGRLSFHAKAHPHAMYAGLQAAAERSGRKLVLVQCGWFANKAIEDAFRAGAASACPDVRCLFTDGQSDPGRRDSWAAADLFVSLSDNIQESFGLSPLEAMAAGLPVVVSDWDGYKDTVRDGIDGFRIPTWMAAAGAGAPLAQAYESGLDTYDMYCGLVCQHVAVDHRILAERLTALVTDAGLRARLGEAGRRRAREVFDWAVVYARYQALWRELDALRRAPSAQGAPDAAPARLDPFTAFGHYATAQIDGASRVCLREGGKAGAYETLAAQPLYNYAARFLPPADAVGRLMRLLSHGPMSVADMARALRADEAAAVRWIAMLAKMGLVELASAP